MNGKYQRKQLNRRAYRKTALEKKAAAKLRKNIDAAEYKHVVLGLIFLRYISDKRRSEVECADQGKSHQSGGASWQKLMSWTKTF